MSGLLVVKRFAMAAILVFVETATEAQTTGAAEKFGAEVGGLVNGMYP